MKKTTASTTNETFWDVEHVVSMIKEQTGKSATRIALCKKDGKEYIDIRKFVSKDGGEFNQHTVKGISIPLDSPDVVKAIIAGIQKAGAKGVKR